MDKKKAFNDSQFNSTNNLVQRLYLKYSDTGKIIPNIGKNLKRHKRKLIPKEKLPSINKQEATEETEAYPPLHYPKGFEKFTAGMDAKAKERALGTLPRGLSRLEMTLKDSPEKSLGMFNTIAIPSPTNDKPLIKKALMPPSRLLFNEKTRYATIGGLNPDGIKSVTLLKKVRILKFKFDLI